MEFDKTRWSGQWKSEVTIFCKGVRGVKRICGYVGYLVCLAVGSQMCSHCQSLHNPSYCVFNFITGCKFVKVQSG